MSLTAVPTVPTARLSRPEWRGIAVLLGVVLAMNVVAWLVLIRVVVPQNLTLGTQVFGIGLGVTAFTLGVRHAFDVDHIAAIDNVTRKLLADGRKPVSVGFWFALGHSTIVVVLAGLVVLGTHAASALTDDGSPLRNALGIAGTSLSGAFLLLIGVLNLVALIGVVRVYRRARTHGYDPRALDAALDDRGVITRLLRPLLRAVRHPAQMYPVGLLFGLGFDTASEITLLVLAGAGVASGLPWYAVLVLPLLFTAGMTLFDTLDGAFMNVAYRWAFANPVRKIYYNLVITGLSVAVALLIGGIQLVGVLHDKLDLTDPVTGLVASLDLSRVGFVVVGLFVVVWAGAVAFWKLGSVEQRWALPGQVEPGTGNET